MPTGHFVRTVQASGGSGVEFLDAFFYPPGTVRDHLPTSETIRQFLSEAKDALDETGIKVHAIAVTNDFDHEDAKRLKVERDKIKLGIELAQELGAPVVRVFSGNPKSSDGIEMVRYRTIDALKALSTDGVTLALENHGNVFSTPSRLNSILDPLKESNVGFCFDMGNFVLAGVNPSLAVTDLPTPDLIHIKDFSEDPNGPYASIAKGNDPLKKFAGAELGQGVVPLLDTLQQLDLKVIRPVAIDLEMETGQDGTETVTRGVTWLKEQLAQF
jgi:sugar phosphate isomerase/epimerase